jgi:BCD family chlorophyll transporter-like MFS transporter
MTRGLNYLNAVRLGLFSLGYGLTSALIGGTLNRIMAVEMGIAQSAVGLLFAAPLLIAPLRAWMGDYTDRHPVTGLRRVPYMIGGSALAGFGVVLAILLLTSGTPTALPVLAGVFAFFLLHEAGRNLAHNSFQALLAERFPDRQRPRAATLYEIVLLLGITIGAGGIGSALEPYNANALVGVTVGVSVATFVLSVIASLGSEPRVADRAAPVPSAPFGRALRQLILADRQVRLFFTLILLVALGTLAQDVLLEPYGAFVLGMPVDDTTGLTAFWGVGVIAAMLASGIVLIPRLGQIAVLRAGLALTIPVFAGVLLAGINGSVDLFRGMVLLMGLGTGLAGAGLLTSVLSFTTAARAGLLMGVWGFAMVLGRSLGGLFGGVIVDVLRAVGSSYLSAYGVVFVLEGALLIIALALTARIQVRAARVYHEGEPAYEGAIGAASIGSAG